MSFADSTTDKMTDFIRSTGIPVELADLPDPCFVPGIRLERGRLLVDPARLAHPGDLLHEAGHIAVMTPERRARKVADASNNLGDEIAAIAWSWGALTHLGVPPEIVFHPAGYRGASAFFIKTYGQGIYPGLPLLQWMGLALDPTRAAECGMAPYPHMLRWLRPDPAPDEQPMA